MGVSSNVEIDDTKLAYMISGEEISHHRRYKNTTSTTKLLELKNFSRQGEYHQITLDLFKGETLGIIGLLGSGRTELALSIFGMTKPDAGELFINGQPFAFQNNREAIKAGIAYVPEDRISEGLVIEQNIERNMTITILHRIKSMLGIVDSKRQRALTERWIKQLHIKSALPGLNASALSGGNQQKIVLSKWLATDPQILILDEPTNGVDVAAKSAIYDIIKELADTGMGIIIISDEVPEIYYNCSRAIIMHEGTIKAVINTAELSEEEFYQHVIESAE
jgi:ABC-type sugar transport system ATPase subunit